VQLCHKFVNPVTVIAFSHERHLLYEEIWHAAQLEMLDRIGQVREAGCVNFSRSPVHDACVSRMALHNPLK
jgi:hypothetical protein